MKAASKRLLLASGLIATLVLTWFAPSPGVEVAPAAKRPRSPDSPPAASTAPAPRSDAGGRLLAIRSRSGDDDIEPAFVARSWEVQKPKAQPASVEPPPPQAPPLPFKFLGRYVEEGRAAVFLQDGDRNLVIRQGDVIENRYRVEAVADGNIAFVYLPLNQKQTLIVGDSK